MGTPMVCSSRWGRRSGGFSLFVQDGRLQYVHNYLARFEDHLAAAEPLAPGPHTLAFSYRCDEPWGGGHGALHVDGEVVAEADFQRFTPMRWSITGAGVTCGYDGGSAVTPRYRGPFHYTGALRTVVVEAEPAAGPADYQAAADAALRGQ